MERKMVEVCAWEDKDNLLFIFGAALRYALGRKSYATGLVSSFLIENVEMYNEKWLHNFLKDIEDYEMHRVPGQTDHLCDYDGWMKLKAVLEERYAEIKEDK